MHRRRRSSLTPYVAGPGEPNWPGGDFVPLLKVARIALDHFPQLLFQHPILCVVLVRDAVRRVHPTRDALLPENFFLTKFFLSLKKVTVSLLWINVM